MRIYLYGFSPEQQSRINGLLARLASAPAVEIRPEFRDATLATILDGQARVGAALTRVEPVVLFHEAEDAEIETFITSYKVTQCPEPIWAAVTEANLGWTFGELLSALQAERQALAAGEPPQATNG